VAVVADLNKKIGGSMDLAKKKSLDDNRFACPYLPLPLKGTTCIPITNVQGSSAPSTSQGVHSPLPKPNQDKKMVLKRKVQTHSFIN